MNRAHRAVIVSAALVALGGPVACTDAGSRPAPSVAPIELRGDAGGGPPAARPSDGRSEARPVPPPLPLRAGDDGPPTNGASVRSPAPAPPPPPPPPPADDDGPEDDADDADDPDDDVDDVDDDDDDDVDDD